MKMFRRQEECLPLAHTNIQDCSLVGKNRAGMGTCSRIRHSNGFPHSSAGKESACNSGDPSLIPGSGRYPGEGIGYSVFLGFPCGSAGKESTCNEGDLGLIPGLGRSPGEGKGYPLQYSGLENSVDSVVHGVTKSQI